MAALPVAANLASAERSRRLTAARTGGQQHPVQLYVSQWLMQGVPLSWLKNDIPWRQFNFPQVRTPRLIWYALRPALLSEVVDHATSSKPRAALYQSSHMPSNFHRRCKTLMVVRHATEPRTNQGAEVPCPLDLKPPTSPNKTTPENHRAARR
jgi:hypothetical protein